MSNLIINNHYHAGSACVTSDQAEPSRCKGEGRDIMTQSKGKREALAQHWYMESKIQVEDTHLWIVKNKQAVAKMWP